VSLTGLVASFQIDGDPTHGVTLAQASLCGGALRLKADDAIGLDQRGAIHP